MAWRIASNSRKYGFENDYYIPLESIKWKRIIIDEIHMFFNNNFKFGKSLYDLSACFYWGLTGTPMVQNDTIMHQYINFISSPPQFWVPEFLQ